MTDDDPSFTSAERGDSHPAVVTVGRLVVGVGVVAVLVAVILAGNWLAVGRFLPWVEAAPQPTSALAAPVPTATAATDAAGSAAEPEPSATPLTPAEILSAQDWAFAALTKVDGADPALDPNVLVLEPPQTMYSLGDLVARGAVRQDDDATYTLLKSVVVRRGAELLIDAPGATLRMLSDPTKFRSIVGWGGNVGIVGAEGAPVTLVGWDEQAGAPDANTDDGRSFVLVRDGALLTRHARLDHLGYWSGRTGGLAVTSTAAGLSMVAVEDTELVDMHYGLFLSAVSAGTITGAHVAAPRMSGIEVTGGSQNITIADSDVDGAGTNGLGIDRASAAVTVMGSRFADSARWGIDIDGRPLADGPSASGAATTRAETVSITDSTVEGNLSGGIRSRQLDDLTLTGTTVASTDTAVRIDGPSTTVLIDDADLTSLEQRGLLVDEGVDAARITGSSITGQRIALELVDAEATVTGNTFTVPAGHGLEAADGTKADVIDNTFVGAGQDPVSVLGGSTVVARGSDISRWTPQIAAVVWMNEHPMMWMWATVLVIPVVGIPLLARRRRTHRELRALLEAAIVSHGAAQIAAYGQAEEPVADETAPAAPLPAAPGPDPDPPVPSPSGRLDPPISSLGAVTGPPLARPPASRPATSRPLTPTRPAAPTRAATEIVGSAGAPRSFADLRTTGPLADREFDSLQQFAIAAVLEAGYPVGTIARLFRVPSWRLQQWVQEVVEKPAVPPAEPGRRPAPGRRVFPTR